MAGTICSVDAWTSLRRVGLAYFWSILIWVGFSPALAFQDRTLLIRSGQSADFWGLLLVFGVWLLSSALLTPPVFYIVRRYPITKGKIRRLGSYILGYIPFLIASVLIRWIALPPWNESTQQFTPRSVQALIGNLQLFANLIWNYVTILVAAHAYGYLHQTQAQDLERAELQQALARSELQSLKAQIHPHFLFNTMQGVSILIDSDPRRAKAMVLKLSGLLRTTLEHGNFDLISLSNELKLVEDYLELQRMRLEDRLCVRWNVAPETRQMLVPQLILQPLVENAIVHGIANCREGGWIQIAAKQSETMMELSIKNSVGGRASRGMGLGLQHTRARLKHLYGDEAKFSFEIESNGVATATIFFPGLSSRQTDAARAETQRGVRKSDASLNCG